jgi:hypothetical protein
MGFLTYTWQKKTTLLSMIELYSIERDAKQEIKTDLVFIEGKNGELGFCKSLQNSVQNIRKWSSNGEKGKLRNLMASMVVT